MDLSKFEDLLSETPPWGEIGYITYKRTYSRKKTDDTSEEFRETVERELKGIRKQLHLEFSDEETADYIKMRMSLLGSVAGRFMWQLGTKTVTDLGLASLQNCAFCVVNSPIEPFTWTMDMLMLGSGVGYSIRKEHVFELPKVRRKVRIVRQDDKSADFIVPDTREGWVRLLSKVLKSHFYSGKGFSYSTQLIRSKGARIGGFGGVASGPEDLCWGMEEISKILNARAGKKVRPIDCLDVMNIIGSVVVAGNVRRSAQIAIGDPDDLEFLRAKRFDLGPVPNWRDMSNNSVATSDIELLPQEFWDTYQVGEPYGLINLDLLRKVGRTGEEQYPDPTVWGCNPCAEQGLADRETCCLAEIYLPNIKSQQEMNRVAELLYKVCKHSLAMRCHHETTQEVVNQNMRMGIGATGIEMSDPRQLAYLDPCYLYLRELDAEYSAQMGWPTSVKLTTLKPSGTLSLLPGVTPGIHPSPAGPCYIRRMRMSSYSSLVETCRQHGYPVEPARRFDGSNDPTTQVVSFPCRIPDWVRTGDQVDVLDQLDMVRRMQREWSDNSVSVTAYYRKEDIPRIREYLIKYFRDEIKSVSFLLYYGHGFDQAPYETISEERYLEMSAACRPITELGMVHEDEVEQQADCQGGSCPTK